MIPFGAIAGAAGGLLQTIAAQAAAHKMQQSFVNELDRQEGWRNRGFTTVSDSLPLRGVEEARKEIAQGAQHRQDLFGQVYQPGFGTNQNRNAREKAQYDISGASHARLGGYQDWQINQMINNIRTQDALNRISNFSQGQAQVFPYSQYDAQHSMDWLSAIGGILASAGGAASGAQALNQAPQGGMFGSGQPFQMRIPANQGFDFSGFDATGLA